VLAQTRTSSVVSVRVSDSSGAAISGADITLRNSSISFVRSAKTNASGTAEFAGLPLTGHYDVSVSKEGFASASRAGVQLRAGELATFDIRLNVAGASAVVNVLGTIEGVRTDSAELSSRFDLAKIDETPVLGRKVTTLPLLNSAVRPARGTGDLFIGSTLFVINGGGRRQTTFVLDNATGDDSWGRQTLFTSVPLTSVQEVTVLTNAESAEYGRSTGSAVNIVTKSGTNTLHGEGIGLWQPSSLGAKAPLSLYRTGQSAAQGSGTVSGPIVKDRTFFTASAEYTHQLRDSVITSPLAFGSVYTGELTQSLLLGRIDHTINQNNRLMLRLNSDRLRDTNPADSVGALNLPSTARIFQRKTYAGELSEVATLNDHLVNEARFQVQVGSPITQFTPVTPSPQFVRPGAGTEGDSRYALLLNHQYEWGDTVSWIHGKHSLRFGMDAIYSSSGGVGQEYGGGFVLGQFTLPAGFTAPISQVTIADVTRYTQAFGNLNYHVGETLWGAFVQDNFAVTDRLTLNLGLRYDNQSLTDDNNNFSPRVGFAYRLPHLKTTVVRGSYGIFVSEVRSDIAAGYSLGGPTGIFSFSAAPGQLGFPTSLAPLPAFPAGAVLPPRDITVNVGEAKYLSQFLDVSKLRSYPDKLLNPYSQQWTLGFERELSPTMKISVDYVGQHSLKIERPVDLNAPVPFIRTAPGQVRSAAAADATRPITPVPNGYRRIIAYVNQGDATYNGLQVQLNKRLSHRLSGLVSYTWSHAINTVDPDIPQQDPNDSNLTGVNEKATSLLDQRHRVSISGSYQMPWRVAVGTWFTAAAGRPFNVTTGVDNNGDGSNSDRPVVNGVILPRNAGLGTPTYDLAMFVEKVFPIGERANVSLRGEAFNLTNHLNVVGRNGVYGNGATPLASYGSSLSGINNVDPARQFQFLMRISF